MEGVRGAEGVAESVFVSQLEELSVNYRGAMRGDSRPPHGSMARLIILKIFMRLCTA